MSPGEYISIGISIGVVLAAAIYEIWGDPRPSASPTIYCTRCRAHVGLLSWPRHLQGHQKDREIPLRNAR